MKHSKHVGEVIEVYDSGAAAAVQFKYGKKTRVECISAAHSNTGLPGEMVRFKVGQSGMVQYALTLSGGFWFFTLTRDLCRLCSTPIPLPLMYSARAELNGICHACRNPAAVVSATNK
jgi:hypothetical protein